LKYQGENPLLAVTIPPYFNFHAVYISNPDKMAWLMNYHKEDGLLRPNYIGSRNDWGKGLPEVQGHPEL